MVSVKRLGQMCLTFSLGLYFLLVAFNNVFDYDTNFKFVEHVLNMDSIPYDRHVLWRAIGDSRIHHLAYITIITWEFVAGVLLASGALLMSKQLKSQEFESSKKTALIGAWIGLLLWVLPFITFGGEWFMMWESPTWNGELAALRMFVVNAVMLIALYLPE